MEKKEFVCKFCKKQFPSGKSLGGHIRIHMNNKRLREITPLKQQQECRLCGKSFCSSKALANHMDCHSYEGGKTKNTQSASETTTTTTSSGPTMMKRSKKQSSSDDQSFSIVTSSSDPEVVQGAKDLMFLHLGRKDYNLAMNSLPESSENNSEILETKSSSGELLKTDDDGDNGYSSDSDYFLHEPKKSDSDILVGGSLRNTGFNSFSNGDELRSKEGGSNFELSKSKRVSPFYESDSSADTNSKIHKSSDGMVKKASGANKNSGSHVCPVCYKVYSSGQALGGHKRSHSVAANQEHRITHKADDMQFDLNLPETTSHP